MRFYWVDVGLPEILRRVIVTLSNPTCVKAQQASTTFRNTNYPLSLHTFNLRLYMMMKCNEELHHLKTDQNESLNTKQFDILETLKNHL